VTGDRRQATDMKLSELTKNVNVLKATGDVDVCDITCNSSDVRKNTCFVAIKGDAADGHDFVTEAVARGATAIVSEHPVGVSDGIVNIVVASSRHAMAVMSALVMGDPSKFFTLIGVTGTNGKTTITYLLESIFRVCGKVPGVIGTVNYRFAGSSEKAGNTTPESIDLQRLFCRMKECGVDSCAMEVSSHALVQERVTGCHFDAAIFTNLTPEHLDYHEGMEDYFSAKAILFERLLTESGKAGAFAVINGDDQYGRKLKATCPVPVCEYGLTANSDVSGSDLHFDSNGLEMRVVTPRGSFECRSRLCGRFNAQNILAATAVAERLGMDLPLIKKGIEEVVVVPGRFESIGNDRGILALVDYAHTPDALENVLVHARELLERTGGRLITVFGCGGDRDRTKRPLMGEVVGRLSDVVLVTSDNPRNEKPETIIDEILPGVCREAGPMKNGSGYEVLVERRDAIEMAVKIAAVGDVIVVAGKGHEDYQILGTKRIHFDDREVLRETLNRRPSPVR